MAALLISLKLTLIVASLKRSVWQTIGLTLGALYGLGISITLLTSLIVARLLSGDHYQLVASIVAIVALIAGVAHLILPLLYGADDSMAPARFVSFGIRPKTLAPGLLVAAFVSIVVVCELVVMVGVVVFMSTSIVSTLVAIVSCALFLLLLVVSSRVVVGLGSQLFSGRRAKEAIGIVSVVVVSCVWFVVSPLMSALSDGNDFTSLAHSAGVLAAATPWGALVLAPTMPIAQGLLSLGYGAVVIAVLYYCWYLLVRKQTSELLVARDGSTKGYKGLGLFNRMPATVRGGILARVLTYWWRDNRYRSSLILALLVPIGICVISIFNGMPAVLTVVIVMALVLYMVPLMVFNDLAYDNTAFAWHVVAGVRGRDDVISRLIGPAAVCAITTIVFTVVVALSSYSEWTLLAFGAAVGLVGSTLGSGAIMMVQFPYAAVAPGANPMKKPKGANTAATLIQSVAMLAVIVLVAPSLVCGGLYIWMHNPAWLYVGAAWGLVIGVGGLVLGTWLGCRIYDRRQVEIYATIRRFADAD